MKKIIFVLVLSLTCSIFSSSFADVVETSGTWGDNGKRRTLVSAQPVISIEKNVLSIYLEDIVESLTIIITDNDNNIIYEDCISTWRPNQAYSIVLDRINGEQYTIVLTHLFGTLIGNF